MINQMRGGGGIIRIIRGLKNNVGDTIEYRASMNDVLKENLQNDILIILIYIDTKLL